MSEFLAYYANGIVMAGASDDTSLGVSSWTESWAITGKPGHLTAKGQWMWYNFYENLMEAGTLSMKQRAAP